MAAQSSPTPPPRPHAKFLSWNSLSRTRLTIVASSPEGYEFTIRTPGTPDRWQQYDEELIAVWGRLTEAVCEDALSAENRRAGEEDDEREAKEDLICDLILQVSYYHL